MNQTQCRLGWKEEDKPRHEGSGQAGYWLQSSSPPANQKGIINQSSHRTSSVCIGCKKMPDCFSSYPSCLSVSHIIHSTQESLKNSMFHVSCCHWLRVSEIDRGIQIHKCYIYLYLFTWRMVALSTRPFGRRGRLSGNFSSKYCTGHQIRLEDTRVIDKVFHQISWIQLDKRSCQMIDCRKTVDYAKIRLICKS